MNVTWTNTNGTVAAGHTVERSNTTGSRFATLGTTSPSSVVTLADAKPAPTTLRYYRAKATVGGWISTTTAEVVSARHHTLTATRPRYALDIERDPMADALVRDLGATCPASPPGYRPADL